MIAVELRDYQISAALALLANRREIIQSPAGSGQTIIGAVGINRWTSVRFRMSRRKMRVAWVANTTEQCDQARKALGVETFHALKGLLRERKYSTGIGDEGGV